MASKTTNYNLDMPAYNEIADIDVINGNMDKIDVQMKNNADSAQQSKDIVSDKYSATNTYAVGDYCIHENILYKCNTAITTGEEFDSNKWVQTTCGTEFGELNSNLNEQGLFKKSTITINSGISYESGGVYTAEKTFSTDYINVSGYTKITCNKYSFTNNLLWGAFYDSSKNYISGFNQNSKTITVPNNANYIRLTFMNKDIDDVYICVGVIGDIAEEVNQQNESLDEQGLLNKVTEMRQGKWNISSGVSEGGDYYVSSKESISCNGNSNIKLKCDNAEAFDIVFFNGSSFISGESKNGSELLFTTPSNATSFKFNIYNGNKLTPQNVGKIEVYVDSQIEQLKNDLSTKIYELAGSELYLCVSGNSCVLTLNGYNLTGSTNFSKLAEYPPYLVARNVVSKKDGVCMISVDPNGNISASDLQVASSLTGQIFGEVSWLANI